MKLQIFSVYDLKTQQFGNPMFMISKGQVIRSFGDEVNKKDPNNQLNTHPEDFVLYHLGDYETSTGTFTTAQPAQVALARDLKIQE
jgi:hypothetical protein